MRKQEFNPVVGDVKGELFGLEGNAFQPDREIGTNPVDNLFGICIL